ncbi:AbrB/MazE/SpoVT family DNA-binding domain-containing protein [Candidatus Micrarchaeota archaeon]|nr:AbrB/MazE/SpoVT family DNA-binding domain-containing protein [Candidatus Micrarchaeota archaeon]
MASVVSVKIRPVGNSLGFILPKKLIREERIREGDDVEFILVKRRKIDVQSLLGIAKGTPPFVRRHGHRD